MTEESTIHIAPADLTQIVESVFRTMLGLEVRESGTPWFPDRERLTTAVHYSGACNGTVLLECTARQACLFAGRFLSMQPPPDEVDDVVRDTLGELANMIGGNLKCVLARGIQLSMPSVVDGSDYAVRICGAVLQSRLAFQCSEGGFWISVLTTRF